jgi:hypothetical protein
MKALTVNRALMIRLIFIFLLAFAVSTGFVLAGTDQVIAPPGVRIMNWLWSVFSF